MFHMVAIVLLAYLRSGAAIALAARRFILCILAAVLRERLSNVILLFGKVAPSRYGERITCRRVSAR
jgi:energy-converting hydrogenase Eha subunit C